MDETDNFVWQSLGQLVVILRGNFWGRDGNSQDEHVMAAMLMPFFVHSSDNGDGAFRPPESERPQFVNRVVSRPWTTRRMYELKFMQFAAEWAKQTISTAKIDVAKYLGLV